MFYIEADDRSSAIYVQKADHTLRGGMRANLTGTVQTDDYGERYIEATTAAVGSTVSVHYTLWDTDCFRVESSLDSGDPLEFVAGIGNVIQGFDEGVIGMKAGGKRFLIIPPELGYGEEGSPPSIPPNVVLLYEVELVSVQ